MAEAKKPAAKPEQSSSTKFSQEALGKDAAKIIDKLNSVVHQTSVDQLLGTNLLINDSKAETTETLEETQITEEEIVIEEKTCSARLQGLIENMRSISEESDSKNLQEQEK